jgi:hypothetical protein
MLYKRHDSRYQTGALQQQQEDGVFSEASHKCGRANLTGVSMERLFEVVPELLECVAWSGSARIL